MVYYRTELNKFAQSCGEAAVKANDAKQIYGIFGRMAKLLSSRKNVLVVCFMWTVIAISPVVVIDFMLKSNRPTLVMILRAAGMLPLLVLTSLLACNVTNKFGVVGEYKMGLLAICCTYVIRFSLFFTVLADSYYRILIDFECRALIW